MSNAKQAPVLVASELRIAQQAGELFWSLATSENHNLASSRSPAYRHAELMFIETVAAVYGITRDRATRVRDFLGEYGPNDSLRGTNCRGVSSYVQYTLQNTR